MSTAENTILFGKYQVCQVLGSGRSGTVYKARHVMLDEYRAIKQVPVKQDFKEDPEREIRILKGLKHPGIPIIYDVFQTEDSYHIVEEFLEGESLFALISRRGSLSKAETVLYGIQLCRIINYLHHSADNPILHLDLQPKNLLLCQNVLKLIDFDQAVFKEGCCFPERRYGTVGCAAPEQYKKEPLDERTDIYAIGALLFYMRKGMFPQTGAVLEEGELGLAMIIERCLQERKEERYESVQILLEDLITLKEENFSNQLQSSLVIAFAGSKSGIGTTHASLGLAAFLADRGIPVLYEEKNPSGAVWQIADSAGVLPDAHGIVHVEGWSLLPCYGPSVRLSPFSDSRSLDVRIRDYGNQWEDAADDPDVDVACLVCGGKCWERKQTDEAIQHFLSVKRLFLLVNHLGEGRPNGASVYRSVDFARKKTEGVFRMPFFPEPWRLERREMAFYEALYKALSGKGAVSGCGGFRAALEKFCVRAWKGRSG